MFRLISPSSTTMTRICDGQFHYHRWFFCCLQVNNSQNLSSLKNLAFLTWFSGRMNEGDSSLWSDHHEPSVPHLSGLGGIILISDHHQPVPGVVTSDNLSPDSRERRAQRPHSPGREINCLNKNLHPDQLGNRCPEHTLQVTLIDLYLIYCYNQRRACINNTYLEESAAVPSVIEYLTG